MILKDIDDFGYSKTLIDFCVNNHTEKIVLKAVLHLVDNCITYQVLHYGQTTETEWTYEKEFFVLAETSDGQKALEIYEDARNILIEKGV